MVSVRRRDLPLVADLPPSPPTLARHDPIPNVRAIIAAHRDPIERNEAFNAAYQRIARGIQAVIGPGMGVVPNWFAVGAYASPQVGRSMMAAHQTLHALELLRSRPHPTSRDQVFDELGLRGHSRQLAVAIAGSLELPAGAAAATAIASFISILLATDRATSTRGLADPRLAIAVAYRLHALLQPGGGLISQAFDVLRAVFDGREREQILDNLERLCRTYESLLAEGNRAIFADIGGSATAFLRLNERRGPLEPETVLTSLRLPESSAAGSRRIYERALEHAFDRAPPTDFSGMAAPGAGNDLVRAAFALYTLAGQTRDLDRKNAIVSFANNLVAWREQFETVQPAFTESRIGELDRGRVLAALTPLVQVPFNDFTWKFSSFAKRQPFRDLNPLTARAGGYDWSRFPDRWPAILDAFRVAYRHGDELWRFPNPNVRSA